MALDHVIEWGKKLKPPSGDAEGSSITAWRWTVAVTLGATALSLAAHIALACGLITAVHPGFALASDVMAIREERRAERETDLETKILDVRQKQCMSDDTVKALHTQTLQKMLVEYNKLTDRQYPLPGCADFR